MMTDFKSNINTIDMTLQKLSTKPVATPDDISNVDKKISAVDTKAVGNTATIVTFKNDYEKD